MTKKLNESFFQSLTLQYQACRPQFLPDQLTLSQPGGRGADYAHQMILAPPDFQIFLRPWIQSQVYLNSNSTLECSVILTNNVSMCSSFIPLRIYWPPSAYLGLYQQIIAAIVLYTIIVTFVGFWLSWRAYGLPQYSEFNVLDQIGLKNCAYFKGKIVATAKGQLFTRASPEKLKNRAPDRPASQV